MVPRCDESAAAAARRLKRAARAGPPVLPAALAMLLASALFSLMSVGVKAASARYGAGEIVFYRSAVGMVLMAALLRWRGAAIGTRVPGMHLWRSISGTLSLLLWFHALGGLPLGTAVTLNYMSSIWIALFLMGGAVLLRTGDAPAIDGRLVGVVLAGFTGVALVLQPTMDREQLWHGLAGLLSGLLAAMAYLQVATLGRAGEPEDRTVFYFSLGGVVAGAGAAAFGGGWHGHDATGLSLLLGIGLLATAAQWLLTQAYTTGTPLANAALQYLGIVFSFGLGVWLFDDPVTTAALAGMALIIAAGLAATLLRERAAPGAAPPPT